MDPSSPARTSSIRGSSELAHTWTDGADSDYEKVLAIQQHFHSDGFQYSTDVDVADDPTPCSRSSRRRRRASASSTPRRWRCWSASSGCPRGSPSATRPARSRTTAAYLVQSERRPRLGRGLLRGLRLAPVRADPGARHPPERGPGQLPEPGEERDEPRRAGTNPDDPSDRGTGRSRMRRDEPTSHPVSASSCARSRTDPSGARATSSRLPAIGTTGRRTGRGTRCRTG